MRPSLVLLGAAAACLAGAAGAPAAPLTGELRTLYVVATWGPVPFSTAEVELVAAQTDAFFRASSSGRLTLPSTVAPAPLILPRAVFSSCDATAIREAGPPSMFAGYDRIAFITPQAGCSFLGEANPTEVLLHGAVFRSLAAHELGHTLGLGHASRWRCNTCALEEYGNPFSVMGSGDGDLNAPEKAQLEWLTSIVRASGSGLYELGPIEGGTTLPQALVVPVAGSELWFESRAVPTPSFTGTTLQPAGVVATAAPGNDGLQSLYPRGNLLLANPVGGSRFSYAPGESVTRPGVVQVTVESHDPARAVLRVRWLDRIRPGRPGLDARPAGGGRVRLEWAPAVERGSGVASYTVRADGRRIAVLTEQPLAGWRTTLRLSRGRHTVGVFGTDRAGNRGLLASRRVLVK